jgi:hypothetical protein
VNNLLRWRVSVKLDWHDIWFGVYWKRNPFLSVWICLLPCLPIRVWLESLFDRCIREPVPKGYEVETITIPAYTPDDPDAPLEATQVIYDLYIPRCQRSEDTNR